MYCSHCGKENITDNKFCEHCGKPLTPQTATAKPNIPQQQNTPPQQAYPWKQTNIDPEVKRKWEEQKAHERNRRIEKRVRINAVLWLIAGILQVFVGIVGIVDMARSIITNDLSSANDVLSRLSSISWLFFYGVLLLLGSIGIYTFVKTKRENTTPYINKISVLVTILMIQLVIIGIIIFRGLMPISFLFSDYWSMEPISVITICRFISLLMDWAIPLVLIPTVFDIVNIITVKSFKDVFPQKHNHSKKSNIIWIVILAFTGCLLITSFGIEYVYDREQGEYDAESSRIINLVKEGHLDGYPDMPIEKTLNENIYKKDKSEGKVENKKYLWSWNYYPGRFQERPDWLKKYDTGIAITANDAIVSTYFSYSAAKDNKVAVDIAFKLDQTNNTISVYAISKNGFILDKAQTDSWISEFFKSNRQKLIEQGEYYMKNGVYVSDTQTLYSAPNYNSSITYTYTTSGTKTVYDYQISNSGTLWLKLRGTVDGKTYDRWIPAPNN